MYLLDRYYLPIKSDRPELNPSDCHENFQHCSKRWFVKKMQQLKKVYIFINETNKKLEICERAKRKQL